MSFSRMFKDSVLYDISVTQDEIIKLREKEAREGLSQYEYSTLQTLLQRLRNLRRITYEN